MATAGTPTNLHFNQTTGEFLLTFLPGPGVGQPTVIFVPPLHYSTGYNVTVSDNLQWRLDDDNSNIILVTLDSSGAVWEGDAVVAIKKTGGL